jgi:probable rRNA maturation factor
MTEPEALRVHFRVASAYAEKIDHATLRRAVQSAFDSSEKKPAGELTLVITDDTQVRELNRAYRGIDATTDVLAFGETKEANTFVSPPEEPAYLGDIVVSYPRSVEQATAHGHSVEEELMLLVVHGALHLIGHDHEHRGDKREMWEAQSKALARLDINWRP